MREGRFSAAASEIAQRYSESVSFDRRLYRHDIAGSIAHASALASAGILSADEFEMIARGLREIENQITAGTFVWDASLEDVHMNIEAALTKRIGLAGAKLHTGRSRNDQIALDLRLFTRDEIDQIVARLRALQHALLLLAQKYSEVLMPGYTHLQRAQPTYFAHYLLAQLEALERDHERLRDTRRRADVMPLGSGALAGSTIALDREGIAKVLGFQRVTQNSIDAVSDRDFVGDFLYSLAMIGIHLSRFSEDLIIWSTSEFGFIEFSDAFATGSSLMPQKKNPDMAELTRGKCGRLIGNLVSLLTILKGLPSSYNRDLQEDKEALFDSVDTVRSALELFSAMLPELTINRERMESLANDPQLLATDLAEYLVGKGVSFREAHTIVGKLAASGKQLDALSNDEFRAASNAFEEDVREVFDVRKALQRRTATGSPSPENIERQIARWRELLEPE
ncbi:MAG: argininosuccinate lyase [Verrucomicrobia bacterium]|nr:MAG: argininosuccinate lyase [Verrucomicrobiota bacterium]PYM08224.1 MAG: argininosuccinate lyase [Verrucomicrobiota bacterium]